MLVVVGAGVSIAATRNADAASWIGLLKLGVVRCRELNPALDEAWAQRVMGEIASGDLDDTLSAAEKIARKLGGPAGGEFSRWLRETVGALQVRDASVLEALRDLQVPLATTNYDDLLERITRLPAVTWREQNKVSRVLRGEEQAVLHLHGRWEEPESVVLGIRDYEQVRQDTHAQAVIRALGMTQTLLFVGCGGGLQDPNFKPFLSWLGEVNLSHEARHYRLGLAHETAELQRQHPPASRLVVIPTGRDHAALPDFLRGLVPRPIATDQVAVGTVGIRLESARRKPRFRESSPAASTAAADSPAILEYLRRLEAATSKLQLIGLGQGVQIELPIQQAYIPLNVLVAGGLEPEHAGHFPSEKLAPEPGQPDRDVPLCDIFSWARQCDANGVLLLGDPGAGKTTGARQFCWRVLRGGGDHGSVVPDCVGSHKTQPPEAGTTNHGLPSDAIPVFLRLRNLTSHHLGLKTHGLQAFIRESVAASALPEDLADPGPALLARRHVLWVFDGLDEVVNENARVHVCGWIKQAQAQRPGDFFLVTSRYQGYQGRVDLGPGFCQFHVKPLQETQVADFVDHWYRAVCRRLDGPGAATEAKAADLAGSLTTLLREPEYRIGRLRELPANPLLLTILCVVHHQDRNLPRRRADLYAKCVRVLVEHWRQEVRELQGVASFDPRAAEAVLAAVAWWMHGEERRTAASVSELGAQAARTLALMPESAGLGRDGVEFIERMRDDSGILAMWGSGRCGFLHLTFQEYLAALHAAQESRIEPLLPQFGSSWWREAILLALAVGSQSFIRDFFAAVLRDGGWEPHGSFLDQCLAEAQYQVLDPFLAALKEEGATPERQLELLRRLKPFNHPDALAVCRELAGSRHAELASLAQEFLQRAGLTVERPRVEIVGGPLEQWVDPGTRIAFIAIPAGEFEMGSEDGGDAEKPVHRVRITKPFRLGKYPVTNAEYERFLQANPQVEPPPYWTNSQFNDPQQPVVTVSWLDAQAFCRWAGARLPTEAEWEYACRSGSQRAFSFGDDGDMLEHYGWYDRNSAGRTHPVGQKKPNTWGLYDMHGNVLEWCADWYRRYEAAEVVDPTGPKDGGARVLRGGGWSYSAGDCRSAYRVRLDPATRIQFIGFRVVLAPRSGSRPEAGGR